MHDAECICLRSVYTTANVGEVVRRAMAAPIVVTPVVGKNRVRRVRFKKKCMYFFFNPPCTSNITEPMQRACVAVTNVGDVFAEQSLR